MRYSQAGIWAKQRIAAGVHRPVIFLLGLALVGKYIFDALGGRSSGRLAFALVCLLVVLSAFWTVWKYANDLRSRQAQDLAANLAARPRVIVYAPRRLQLPTT
jgi:hypothetical protein